MQFLWSRHLTSFLYITSGHRLITIQHYRLTAVYPVSQSTFPHDDKLVNNYIHLTRVLWNRINIKIHSPIPIQCNASLLCQNGNLTIYHGFGQLCVYLSYHKWSDDHSHYANQNHPNLPHQYPNIARPLVISSGTGVLSIEASETNFSEIWIKI